jgi:hypothetical protein
LKGLINVVIRLASPDVLKKCAGLTSRVQNACDFDGLTRAVSGVVAGHQDCRLRQ